MRKFLIIALLLVCCFTQVVSADNVAQIIGNGNTVTFVDLGEKYSWAEDAIQYFAEQGIVNGVGDGKFAPEKSVTREQFAKMLILTFNAPLSTPEEATFSDVKNDSWSYPYVEVCKDFLTAYNNPFGGKPAFHPTEAATREDITVALVKIMGLSENDSNYSDYANSVFSDSGDISPGLAKYVSIAAERKLINGYEINGDLVFGPTRPITRAECVVLLNRATKQAVSTINAELSITANIITGQDPSNVTLSIEAEEGTKISVDGQLVRMDPTDKGYIGGMVPYKFNSEGSKIFVIEAIKGSKRKSLEIIGTYQIGTPVLNITTCPSTSSVKTVIIKGNTKDTNDTYPTVTVNGNAVNVNWDGSWSKEVSLNEGENKFTIISTNDLGKSTTVEKTIAFGVGAPTLNITTCPSTSTVKTVTIKGNTKDTNDTYPTVTVNGNAVNVNWDGSWSKEVSLNEGENKFTIISTNDLGKSTTVEKTIAFTVLAPEITFTNCPEVTNQSSLSLQGKITDSLGNVKLYSNDQEVYVSYDGTFSKSVTLSSGDNSFVFRAVNSYGKSTSVVKTVKFANIVPPTLLVDDVPSTSTNRMVTITGTVNDDLDAKVLVYVNDNKVSSSTGSWTTTITLSEGSNDIIIVATNKFGKSVTVVKKINYTPEPILEPTPEPTPEPILEPTPETILEP